MMRTTKVMLISSLAIVGFLSSAIATDTKPLRALYVTGGGWHDYAGQEIVIRETLQERIPGIELTVSAVDGVQDRHPLFENEDWAEGYDLVIYNKCNAPRYSNPDWIERIVKPHREGLPAVVIHGTLHNYWPDEKESGQWVAFLGVTSRNHERGAPVTVTFKERDHPTLQGLPETWSYEQGELYRIHAMADTAESLAVGVSSDNVEHTVVWTNQFGEGRVFGTSIGHATETMRTEEFQTLLTQGVLWAAGRPDDSDD